MPTMGSPAAFFHTAPGFFLKVGKAQHFTEMNWNGAGARQGPLPPNFNTPSAMFFWVAWLAFLEDIVHRQRGAEGDPLWVTDSPLVWFLLCSLLSCTKGSSKLASLERFDMDHHLGTSTSTGFLDHIPEQKLWQRNTF